MPTVTMWDEQKTTEYNETVNHDINGLLKDLDPYKEQGPDEVALSVLEEFAITLNKPLQILFRGSMK